LKNSSFATTSPGRSAAIRGSATRGVLPTTAELSAPTLRVVTVPSVAATGQNYRNLVRFPGIPLPVLLPALPDRGFALRLVVAELRLRLGDALCQQVLLAADRSPGSRNARLLLPVLT